MREGSLPMPNRADIVVETAWATPGRDTPVSSLRDQFTDAMSRAVTGVTIVTTDGELGRFGQTVSAMSSVSADPPMLLVCINRKSPITAAIERHGSFAVNVLRSDQRRLADTFAGRPRSGPAYDFAAARWETAHTGAPLLTGAIARFDCTLDAAHIAGTHTIYVGVVAAAGGGAGAPLLYGRRSYGELHAFPNPRTDDAIPLETDEETSLKLGDL